MTSVFAGLIPSRASEEESIPYLCSSFLCLLEILDVHWPEIHHSSLHLHRHVVFSVSAFSLLLKGNLLLNVGITLIQDNLILKSFV